MASYLRIMNNGKAAAPTEMHDQMPAPHARMVLRDRWCTAIPVLQAAPFGSG
jgi:hypothetical protein